MHELDMVDTLIREVLQHLKDQEPGKVRALRLRQGGAFTENALREIFRALAAGTALEGVELFIDNPPNTFHCRCGYKQTLSREDLSYAFFVCPQCRHVGKLEHAHELEATEIIWESTSSQTSQGVHRSAWCCGHRLSNPA